MTNHNDSKSSRSSQKRPIVPSFTMDQELKFNQEVQELRQKSKPAVSSPATLSSSVCDVCNNNIFKHTHTPHTPPTPSLSSLSLNAIDADPKTREQIKAWLKSYHITCANFLLRNYSVQQLDQAAEDYEEALREKIRIQNPTGFFRSLLK